MSKIREVYFFGSNYRIFQIISRLYPVKTIYCEKRSFNKDIYDFVNLCSIELKLVQTANDLDKELIVKSTGSLGISHGFGVIFKDRHIKRFRYGIWNIHPGGLPENRGRHPISWDFLNNSRKFGISIHQINEEIDSGYLLSKGYVDRDLKDTQDDIEGKMCRLLESGLIKKAEHNYFSKTKRKLGRGIYYKRLDGRFASVVPKEHDSVFLFNILKAQAKYGGVCVKGKQYTDCIFYNESYPQLYKGYDIFVCKDNKKVGLK